MMTTDKERAETWRRIADCYESLGKYSIAAADARRRADLLDPPKPEWPDGTIAWVTYIHAIEDGHPYQALAQYDASENEWVMERTHTGSACTVTGDYATKVEPLRVLADDEIALPRAAFDITDGLPRDAERARYYAASLEASGYSVGPGVFRAYADALDAEAGEQS